MPDFASGAAAAANQPAAKHSAHADLHANLDISKIAAPAGHTMLLLADRGAIHIVLEEKWHLGRRLEVREENLLPGRRPVGIRAADHARRYRNPDRAKLSPTRLGDSARGR